MKKFFIMLGIFNILSLSACLSTNTSNDTFSTTPKTKIGNMVISTDEFAGTETAVHKDIYMDFTSGSNSLYFEPFFIYDNESVSCFLKIQYEYFGNSTINAEKIILLGNKGKVTIKLTADSDVGKNALGSGSILGTRRIITANEKISKEDYVRLSDFFAFNETVKLGFYMTNNKVDQFKEYSTRAHIIFADAYSYYKNKLESKVGVPSTNFLVFQ